MAAQVFYPQFTMQCITCRHCITYPMIL